MMNFEVSVKLNNHIHTHTHTHTHTTLLPIDLQLKKQLLIKSVYWINQDLEES